TAIGNVKNFIEHDKDGILIYNESDWEKALHNLMENPKKIEIIGRNARATFLKHFSQESIFKQYLSVIKG
ncbi:glycosyltransferase, partial [Gammaproteobacteria bacterium]|nr:glycosyltransferase [Gammaproteobacteria bacterium]